MQTSDFSPMRDEELVLSALLGHIQAFDELVRRFRGAVIFVAEQTLGSREAAEDVAQEAFLLAYKALPQLHDPAKFASWLYAITRHRARRVGAREGRSAPTEASQLDHLILSQSPALTAHPADECVENSERESLRKTLALLPEEYRLALHLRYYEEWPVARIADFLSVPITTVKWRLHHGRALLRRQLAANEEASPDERLQSEQCGTGAPASHVT
ncbi:MAG TPA: sigma-70 family RNA polymerase sigma factor [Chthonomonadaceae bacterium]|nr:sigma-70 family RNA polymerase sigma factor [Chthonomonadaceae bacterium]